MPLLGVNIDHVTTLRQARHRSEPGEVLPWAEPDAVRAAHEAELGGADGITVHLREDRRHIQDRDVERLKEAVRVKLNLEMAATDEMIELARRVRPHTAMLVPEGRDEVTTEGGLEVAGRVEFFRRVVARLAEAGLVVSAFIDADARQVEAAVEAGFDVCELHTGPWAEAFWACGGDNRDERYRSEHERLAAAGRLVVEAGMRLNAGHALNYHNVGPVAALPGLEELHIGHAIVSRAVYVGLREAVREMKGLLAP